LFFVTIFSETLTFPYGASNQAEFFAVAAEYFFERPDLLQSNHPQLYQLPERIIRQNPAFDKKP